MKVLVVCHGNINRSPVCAHVLQHLQPEWEIRQAALKSWYATEEKPWKPERAAKKMREAALDRHEIDLEDHRSRAIQLEDLEWATHVIYMDGGNLKRLDHMLGSVAPKDHPALVPLGRFIGEKRIADPNFMKRGSTEFNHVLDQVVRASYEVSKNLIALG